MKLASLALLLTLSAAAQQTFTDPANLRGERVAPLTGRELPIDQGALGLQQLLRKLNTRASILNIVAHPDDEDGGMMTLYSRGLGARVADLSLTRGEGGQNAVTGDFEDALGLLRTQELLSSDRYPGVDQFFGTEVDFGFSKTKEESFAKWTHERVLYDVVRAIRLYRPLVLTSTWIGGVTDGHGQHQVSGEIAQEAFVAAGDPKVFPELTAEGIFPWQPLKIYARVPMQSISEKGLFDYATGQYTPARFTNYVTGEVTTTPPSTDVIVQEGTTDPLLADETGQPRSYVQFSRIGLGLQKSQVGQGGRTPRAGAFDVSYHRYGSNLAHQPGHETSFFDGVDTSLESIATLAPHAPAFLHKSLDLLQAQIKQANAAFDAAKPAALAPLLGDALSKVEFLIDHLGASSFPEEERANVLHELRIKRVQLNQAVALALGLTFDATSTNADVTAGSPVSVWTGLHSKAPYSLTVQKLFLKSSQGEITPKTTGRAETPELTADRPSISTLTATDHFTTDVTRPYFSRDNIESPVYQLKIPALRNAPQTQPALIAYAQIDYRGTIIDLAHVVHAGDQPVSFVPSVSVVFSRPAGVIPLDKKDPMAWVESRIPKAKCLSYTSDMSPPECNKFADESIVHLQLPQGWKSNTPTEALVPKDETVTQFEGFTLTPPPLQANANLTITATATWKGTTYKEGYRAVGYSGLPRTNLYTPATYRAIAVDLKGPANPVIGYIEGTGDAVFDSLFALYGGHVQRIAITDITPENLNRFQTVILGVRTYSAHPDLHGAPTQALLDYARNGGNVVVQYQTAEFTADDAPYPLTLGRDAEKVVDETDPVQILHPSAPLLTLPNKITPADFNNWTEERGHGFLQTWDPHYTALTEVHDPGEAPQRGGLITTQLGKGRWTYVAFALYRQLPEAVPGAYRVFLNLLNP